MVTKIIGPTRLIVAYGQSAGEWAAWQINSLLGVVLAVIALAVGIPIFRDKQKDQSEKIKEIGLLGAGLIALAAVVIYFVDNRYHGGVGTLTNQVN